MNFWPRNVGPLLQLPGVDVIKLCEARPLCMGIAAWSLSVAGVSGAPAICCFDCVDDLAARARAAGIPINVDRVQPDLCQACGRHVGDQRHVIDRVVVGQGLAHFASQVGPFCGPPCGMRWTSSPRAREAIS